MAKSTVVALGCGLAILISLLFLARGCGSEQDVASEAEWICLECNHVYTFTQKALEAHYRDHYGEPLSCPACDGVEVQPAELCPHCDEAFGRPARGGRCPHCGETLADQP